MKVFNLIYAYLIGFTGLGIFTGLVWDSMDNRIGVLVFALAYLVSEALERSK